MCCSGRMASERRHFLTHFGLSATVLFAAQTKPHQIDITASASFGTARIQKSASIFHWKLRTVGTLWSLVSLRAGSNPSYGRLCDPSHGTLFSLIAKLAAQRHLFFTRI